MQRRWMSVFAGICVMLAFAAPPVFSQQADVRPDHLRRPQEQNNATFVNYASDRFVIKVKENLRESLKSFLGQEMGAIGRSDFDALCELYNIRKIRRQFPWRNNVVRYKGREIDLQGWHIFNFESDVDVLEVVNAFQGLQDVIEVQPIGLHAIDIQTPNDPKYTDGSQWHIDKIQLREAWDIHTGSSSIILAVLDTGVRYYHDDLGGSGAVQDDLFSTGGNMWKNPGESDNGSDDDGNGLIDDEIGYDFIESGAIAFCTDADCGTIDNNPKDDHGHGTHVSGIAAAITDNGIHGAGAAGGGFGNGNGIRIMALRNGGNSFLGGLVDMAASAQGIDYAASKGAKLANGSWGSSDTGGLGDALAAYLAGDRLFFKAAGNDNASAGDFIIDYPDARVVVIGSTDENDNRSSFSSFGGAVDVAAPGTNINSTWSAGYGGSDATATISGTSMATPLAAGVAGLIWSQNPGWSAHQVRDQLVNTADPITFDQPMGSGRINAFQALGGTPVMEPDIDVSPSSLTFGNVNTGSSSDLVVSIDNTGTDDLEVTSLSFSDGSAGFSLVSPPSTPFTIGPSDPAVDVTVRFAPTADGAASDDLVIASDDPDENPVNVGLSGTGVTPVPDIDVSPSSLTFGNVNTGSSSDMVVSIENTGDADLEITSLSLSDGSAGFSLVSPPSTPFTIGPSDPAVDVTVRFAPTVDGAANDDLVIASDDPDENPVNVALSGTGVTATPNIDVSPNSLDFGLVNTGATSDMTVSIENTGDADLEITGFSFADGSVGFSLVSPPSTPFTIGPSDPAVDVTVRFAPTVVGVADDDLEIASDDPDENPFVVSLTGEGQTPPPMEPDIDVTPTSLSFGTVNTGSSSDMVVSIENTGNDDLEVTGLSLSDGSAGFSLVSPPSTPFTIGPSDPAVDVTVRFAPTAVGAANDVLVIASDDPDENPVNVNLDGTGQDTPAYAARINVAGPDFTTGGGDLFVADKAHTSGDFGNDGNGRERSFSDPIDGTTDDDLYQTLSSGGSFEYLFDVANGDYNVTLHFMEPQFSSGGERTFDVTVEGTIVLDDLDVAAESGGQFTAHTESFSANVSDGQLNIQFDRESRVAVVSAIEVTGGTPPTPEPDIDVSPASLAFGTVNTGATNDMVVSIDNTGDDDLEVTSLSFSDGSVGFSLVSPPSTPFTIGPSDPAVDVTVRFAPSVAGAVNDDLVIASNDPDENPVNVGLSGTGQTPPPMEPDIDVTPTSLDFGTVTTGADSDMTVSIDNTGTDDLEVTGISLSDGSAGFTLVSPPSTPFTLTPSDPAVEVTVRFAPTVAGAATDDLEITSDDPDEGTVTVSLDGDGQDPPSGDAFRINVAGDDFTTGSGDLFVADKAHTSGDFGNDGEGRERSFSDPISGTDDDELYQTLRSGGSFEYLFDVANGDYTVTLYFIEPQFSSGGNRTFDVTVEDVLEIDDLDIAAQVGQWAAYTETLNVTVSDGQLNILFEREARVAVVSAIEVVGPEGLAKRGIAEEHLPLQSEIVPDEFKLFQNHPNPFNPETQIRYALNKDGQITLRIYNMLGKAVRTLVNEHKNAGAYQVMWDARNDNGVRVPSGVYIYKLEAPGVFQVRKMILLQ